MPGQLKEVSTAALGLEVSQVNSVVALPRVIAAASRRGFRTVLTGTCDGWVIVENSLGLTVGVYAGSAAGSRRLSTNEKVDPVSRGL